MKSGEYDDGDRKVQRASISRRVALTKPDPSFPILSKNFIQKAKSSELKAIFMERGEVIEKKIPVKEKARLVFQCSTLGSEPGWQPHRTSASSKWIWR